MERFKGELERENDTNLATQSKGSHRLLVHISGGAAESDRQHDDLDVGAMGYKTP